MTGLDIELQRTISLVLRKHKTKDSNQLLHIVKGYTTATEEEIKIWIQAFKEEDFKGTNDAADAEDEAFDEEEDNTITADDSVSNVQPRTHAISSSTTTPRDDTCFRVPAPRPTLQPTGEAIVQPPLTQSTSATPSPAVDAATEVTIPIENLEAMSRAPATNVSTNAPPPAVNTQPTTSAPVTSAAGGNLWVEMFLKQSEMPRSG